jgi:hypothetical protein
MTTLLLFSSHERGGSKTSTTLLLLGGLIGGGWEAPGKASWSVKLCRLMLIRRFSRAILLSTPGMPFVAAEKDSMWSGRVALAFKKRERAGKGAPIEGESRQSGRERAERRGEEKDDSAVRN